MSIESGAGVIKQNTFPEFRSSGQTTTPAKPRSAIGPNRVTGCFSTLLELRKGILNSLYRREPGIQGNLH